MIDISTEEVFKKYLIDKKIVNENEDVTITYLGGGVSATTAFVKAGGKDMLIKQGLEKLKVKEEWLCDPKRMEVEMRSNDVYYKLVPENVPKVLFYDEENYVFGREAAPESSRMWKADLMTSLLDYTVAEKVMRTLVIVHNECAKDSQVAKEFEDKEIFYELRIAPYIEFTLQKYPQLVAYAKPIIAELMDSKITLVHGDYSPKNVVLEERKVFVTDFEVAHYGHPSFDLGFLSNHLVLKAIHIRKHGLGYLSMLKYILNIYFTEMNYMDKQELEVSFLKLLPLLMLARVDGKSPVEYIVDEGEKELVRNIALRLIKEEAFSLKKLFDILEEYVN